LNPIISRLSIPYSCYFLDKIAKKIKKKFKKFKWHRLRHTFATILVRNDVDIYSISELMGHSDITTTIRYLSLNIEKKQESIEKLRIEV
jgi:site-specific recombinase XerD